jgi:hypothetical protein
MSMKCVQRGSASALKVGCVGDSITAGAHSLVHATSSTIAKKWIINLSTTRALKFVRFWCCHSQSASIFKSQHTNTHQMASLECHLHANILPSSFLGGSLPRATYRDRKKHHPGRVFGICSLIAIPLPSQAQAIAVPAPSSPTPRSSRLCSTPPSML